MLTQTLVTNTLKEFLNSVRPKITDGGKSICSFAQPIDSLKKKNLLNELQDVAVSFYLNKKSTATTVYAFNPIEEIITSGENRFQKTDFAITNLSRNIFLSSIHETTNLPLFFGGMTFSSGEKKSLWVDFPDSCWFIPKFAVLSIADKNYFIYNFLYENFADENNICELYENLMNSILLSNGTEETEKELEFLIKKNDDELEWKEKVNEIKNMIKRGEYEKVVLARTLHATINPIDVRTIIERLETNNLNADIFCYKRNDSFFLGATPEKMLSINGRNGQTESLAGSIKRGANKEEDKFYELQLLNSSKDIAEQKIVTKILLESLESICDQIHYSNEALIKKMKSVQHLWNLIEFSLKENVSMFSLLEKIFPTPATCGYPVKKAEELIKKLENKPRGMYAGLIGYFNTKNFGEFLVAIRSAIIKENNLTAYAGSGIVADSDAEKEFAETKLKFSTILSIFSNEN